MTRISGLEKTSLLDYPNKVSAVIFTHGCNLRCAYCHNPELVVGGFCKKEAITKDMLFEFLQSRRKKLDGVVITGGEPLVQEDLSDLIVRIKEMGYLVKLDTNGTYPLKLKDILAKGIIDYVAMDVKFPKSEYIKTSASKSMTEKITNSIQIVMHSDVEYEFRTTYVKKFHTLESVEKIGQMIKGAKKYYIQNFRAGETLNPGLSDMNTFNNEELEEMKRIIKKYVKNVYIR